MSRQKSEFGYFQRNKKWYLWYWESDTRKKVCTQERTKGAAVVWGQKFLAAKEKDRDSFTLTAFTQNFFTSSCKWMERRHAQGHSFSPPVARSRRAHLHKYILPHLGPARMDQITAQNVIDFLLSIPVANQTKNHILYTLKIVFDEAQFQGKLLTNPITAISPFAVNAVRRSILTREEIAKLFPPDFTSIWDTVYWWAFFLTAVTTGMRVGELRALIWDDIDWTSNAISINRAVKGDETIGLPKSNDRRAVFIPKRTSIALENWRRDSPAPDPECYIFFGRDDRSPVGRRTLLTHWRQGLKNAGIATEGRELVIHSLRHTYNTLMRSRVSEDALRYMVGHKTSAMSDRYDQATPVDRLKALLPGIDQDFFA